MSKLTRYDIDQILKSVPGSWVHGSNGRPYEVFVIDHEALTDLVLHLVNRRDDIASVLGDTDESDIWEHGFALYSVETARKLGQALRRKRERDGKRR